MQAGRKADKDYRQDACVSDGASPQKFQVFRNWLEKWVKSEKQIKEPGMYTQNGRKMLFWVGHFLFAAPLVVTVFPPKQCALIPLFMWYN